MKTNNNQTMEDNQKQTNMLCSNSALKPMENLQR